MTQREKLFEVAKVFFKLGCFAFGGPVAHIAMMEEEVVKKRQWMTREYFLDLVGATNLIPGPNSTEMTMHCGHERAGTIGLFVAGICFIFPAIIITGVLAWMYNIYGKVPEVEKFIYGIKPAVLVIIFAAIIKLGKKALKNWELGVLGSLVLVSSFFGVSEIIALLGAGVMGMTYFYVKNNTKDSLKNFIPFSVLPFSTLAITSVASISTFKIFFIFLKVGAVLYGGGMVLFPYLHGELVDTGYFSNEQLIDAVAIGQITPGPVLSTATFIGFQLNGLGGAIAATAGIFLPSFLFVLLLNPLIPRMRKSKLMGYFLDAVNIAAVAVMVAVLVTLGEGALVNWQSWAILVVVGVLTFTIKKYSTIWAVVTGATLGFGLSFIVV